MKKLLALLGITSLDELLKVEGLAEDVKKKIVTLIEGKTKDFDTEFAKNYIPKTEFNDKNTALKDEKEAHEKLKKSIEDLEKEGITDVKSYQEKLTKINADHKTEIDNMNKSTVSKTKAEKVRAYLADQKATNIDLLMKDIDLEKIEISKDGTIFGHESQVTIMKEKYKTMFDSTEVEGVKGGKKTGVEVSLKKGDEGFVSEAEMMAMTPEEQATNWDAIQSSAPQWESE